ncbi:MAG TPA: CRISPR-associated endonuclease Cas2 [Candidatus Omnitrophica bacterium]|nr:CRISPR-associated endonuclease Cas2 [Candidatus Omnitrophota bacterium]
MLVLVSYDVVTSSPGGKRRLRRVAKICLNHGQRVQYSVFECIVDPAQWALLKNELINVIDEEKDSLRFYFLGADWQRHVGHVGAKETVDLERDSLII